MAVKSNLTNMTLVLGLVCLVCSALLGGAYALTKEPIAAAAAAKTERSLALVLPPFDEVSYESIEIDGEPLPFYRAIKDGETVGYAVASTVIGFGGPLSLLVGVTPDGVVYNSSVLSHSETPGLGAKCNTDARFMAQWQGFNPAEKILKVKKDGGDVDAITASTITSRAYARAVEGALNTWKALNGQQTDAASGASRAAAFPAEHTETGGQSHE